MSIFAKSLKISPRALCLAQCRYSSELPANKTTSEKNATSQSARLKMKGWQIHSYGDLGELQYSKIMRMPQIRTANECLIRVHSTTVNPIDVNLVAGYGAKLLNTIRCNPDEIEFPLTLGREFCGELVQKGMSANKKLQLGTKVWGVVPVQLNGSHAEYVVVPDYCLGPAPSALNNEEAASVLYAGLTAWSGLYLTGQLGGLYGAISSAGGGANKRVLVLGGAGSVGSLAIQMLKSQKAQVLSTCAENAVEQVRRLGADCVVDYKNPVEMETLIKYAPYDIVLDCAGQGANYAQKLGFKFKQYITFSSPMLRNIDNSGMGLGLLKNVANIFESNAKSLAQQGGLVKWGFFTPSDQGIEFLGDLVNRKKLLPTIDSRYTFDQLPAAFEKVQAGHLRGKVVINLI